MRKRLTVFALCCVTVLAIFVVPLSRLLTHALERGYSSHIVLVPFITLFLIWTERDQFFSHVEYSPRQAGIFGGLGLLSGTVGVWGPPDYQPTFVVLSVFLFVVASFVEAFGWQALRKATFPVSSLLFMIPVPGAVLDDIIYFLQSKSADLSNWLFALLGVPVLREGFQLALPGLSIEVATECSGINSTVALFILATVFAHETLKTNWARIIFVLVMIPLSIVKNAIRIVTLSILAIRVDPGFLTGRLHHRGGFVFFLITLGLIVPIWLVLRRTERQLSPKPEPLDNDQSRIKAPAPVR